MSRHRNKYKAQAVAQRRQKKRDEDMDNPADDKAFEQEHPEAISKQFGWICYPTLARWRATTQAIREGSGGDAPHE